MATTNAESPSETRLSALLRDSKTLRARLRAERQEKKQQNHPSLLLARKSLRNAYLKLLFNFPFSSRSRGVDSEIWSETSHPGVHVYRSILSQLEKQIKESQRGEISGSGRQNGGESKQSNQKQQSMLAQKYIRIAASFRTYLAEEEMFWRELVGRVVRVFNVEEAKPNLRVLGVVCDRIVAQELNDDTLSTGLDRITGADAEGGDLELQSKVPANRARLLEIIHKGLLCCGDLARYRELYKEEKSEDQSTFTKVSHNHRGGRGGRGRGGASHHHPRSTLPSFGDNKNIGRDYTKARLCYEQARAILPSNGQASNAIAVLATYKAEPFAAVYHYYRALCVITPFEPAKQNLEGMLKRAVEKWNKQGEELPMVKPWEDAEKQKANLSDYLVILHGYFFLPSAGALPPLYMDNCHHIISSLLVAKVLAADSIVQIVVSAIASLWTRRLWRGETNKEGNGGVLTSLNSEQQILLHLVGLLKVLVEVGASETRDAMEMAKRHPSSDPTGSSTQSAPIAKNITAVFRRMLPALRIVSKWLKSHVEYVERSREISSSASQESIEVQEAQTIQRKEMIRALGELWSQYVIFINVIRFAFPFDQLPKLGTVGQSGMTSLNFEEDRDMRGFVPMKKAMLVDATGDGRGGVSREAEENQLHPNEEHLIRIADLLIDAKVIAESDSSPISFDDEKNQFYLMEGYAQSQTDTSLAKSSAVATISTGDQSFGRSEDSKWENGSESTEDAVDLAMRAVDERRRALGTNQTNNQGRGSNRVDDDGDDNEDEDEEDEEDDELILIPPSAGINRATFDVPSASPHGSMPQTADEPMTAQHLLLQVINGNRASSGSRPGPIGTIPSPSPSTPQPQLLFGNISSSTSQGSFGSMAHYGGAWDGKEAMQFMNQQQQQQQRQQQQQQQTTHHQQHLQQQPTYSSAYPIFGSSTPWGPPSRDQGEADWQ